MINKTSANAKLKINKFVDVCMPLFKPIPIRTRLLPTRPRMKNVLNKQIFKMPNFNSSVASALLFVELPFASMKKNQVMVSVKGVKNLRRKEDLMMILDREMMRIIKSVIFA